MTAFVGTFEHTLDKKGRLVLPSKFRAHLERSAILGPNGADCLALWTPDNFASLLERMTERVRSGEVDPRVLRGLTAASDEVSLDQQGRVLISERLRSFASLEREVVLLGANDRVEIWDQATWADEQPEVDALMGDILSQGLGI